MDKESTGRMLIPLGITSSWMRNSPEEYFSTGNHKLMDEVFTRGMVIPLGITISWMLIRAGKIKMREKSSVR
jgi:hypothetical protein